MQNLEQGDQLDELLTCRLNFGRRKSEPCTIVIFGASGDLTVRKLVPALYHLLAGKQLPTPFRIIGFARREKTNDAFRAEMARHGLDIEESRALVAMARRGAGLTDDKVPQTRRKAG